MAVMGKELNPMWRGEIAAGAQLSWVKWLNSLQQAESRAKVLPKLRVSVERKVTETVGVYAAVSHAFNHYGSLRSSSGDVNTFDDEGFVSITDAKIGLRATFG